MLGLDTVENMSCTCRRSLRVLAVVMAMMTGLPAPTEAVDGAVTGHCGLINSRDAGKKSPVFAALAQPDMFRGWIDVMSARPFPADYDTMSAVDQKRYELGRRCAAVYVGMGYKAEVLPHIQAYRWRRMLSGSGQRGEATFLKKCGVESRV